MNDGNAQVMRRAFRAIMHDGDMAAIDDLFASDFTGHDTAGGTFGRDDFRSGVAEMLAAFSDRQVEIPDQVSDGDRVLRASAGPRPHPPATRTTPSGTTRWGA